MLAHPNVHATPETDLQAADLSGDIYTYRADLWCGPCIRSMVARALTRDWEYVPADDDTGAPTHFWNPNTDERFDSEGWVLDGSWEPIGTDTDTFPACADGLPDESDGPGHCCMGDSCLSAEELSDGSRVGHFFRNGLTGDGEEYARAFLVEASGPYQKALAAFYRDAYPHLEA